MSKKIPKVHQYSTTDFPMGKKWKKNKLKFSLHKKNCSATTHYF